MRELLLLATIVLGQLAPNTAILAQVEKKLRLAPKATSEEVTPKVVDAIIVGPTKSDTAELANAAQAVYSIDLASNTVLTAKDIDKRLPVASLTKLMTAYVILKETGDLGQLATVTSLSPQVGDSTMGLVVGDQLTTRSLLDGLLITSGSDAAQTLAIASSGSVEAFVDKMNTAATGLNMTNTHFTNPVGWDDSGNYSTARDMTELTRILLRHETFAEIVQTKAKTVTTTSGRAIPLATTNQLLHSPGYIGVKTGYTFGAGECLISLYKDDKAEVLTTVIGSGARFPETESIKGWILTHFSW